MSSTLHGTYPEPHSLSRTAQGGIAVTNRFYEVTHLPSAGGVIGDITLKRAGRLKLFAKPGSFEIGIQGGPALKAGPCKRIRIREGANPVLEFIAPLCDAGGKASGGFLLTRYEHRWGYMRIRQELQIPRNGWRVQWLLLQNLAINPAFTRMGTRPAIHEEPSGLPGSHGAVQWKRFVLGRAFNQIHTSRFVPRYLALLDPGQGGVEWFVGSQLAQWDYQLARKPGHASLCIAPANDLSAINVRICPLDLAMGWQRLAGAYVFDSYLGIPIMSGRAATPFLDDGFNRKSFPSTEKIADWARRGLTTLRFHHDGDIHGDGIFWKDGKHPPFDAADMCEYDRVIRDCHRHGIKITTYFSNKELHPSLPAFARHGRHWARLPTDRGDLLHNRHGAMEFGVQMCLRSGWLDYLKQYIDTVLRHHALDGTYFDWNAALYCHNPRHMGMKPGRPGCGGLATSPAGHWDVDEFLDLMEWTRRRVGPGGTMIIHNSSTPMAAAENFADFVLGMEFGYTHVSTGVPAPDELPPEWQFMGARSRGMIGYGCIANDAPALLRSQFRALAFVTGVTPWTATAEDLAAFKPLKELSLSSYRFIDFRHAQVRSTAPECGCAVYVSRKRLVLAVGNFGAATRATVFHFNPATLGASQRLKLEPTPGNRSVRVRRERSGAIHLSVTLTPGETRLLSFS